MEIRSIVLLVAAGLVAVAALVRLMLAHRDQLLAEFRQRVRAASRRGGPKEQESGNRPREAA